MFNYSSFSSVYNTEQNHLNNLAVWKTLETVPVVKIALQPFLCVSMHLKSTSLSTCTGVVPSNTAQAYLVPEFLQGQKDTEKKLNTPIYVSDH